VFDVGFWELLIIALLALLVLGPEKLPGIVKTAGNWAGRAKFMARSLRMQVEQEMAREIVAKREAEAAAVTAQRKKEREEKAAETKAAESDAASASTEPGNDRDAPA